MRKALRKLGLHKMFNFNAKIDEIGQFRKHGKTTKTVCLVQVSIKSHMVTDHTWTIFSQLELTEDVQVGDTLTFDAEVVQYEKGYHGKNAKLQALHPITKDYTLGNFANVKIVK